MLLVGEVCKQLNINSQTIYYYERIGLIPSLQRNQSGYRVFHSEDIEILKFILKVKSLGLTLEEIKQLLELKQGRSLTCQAVYNHLKQKIDTINKKINQLESIKQELIPLLQECQTKIDTTNPNHQCEVL
ncbi:transcriptional regulator [Cyanobacterium sp. HL-69]|uniref:MerR family DNA-binding protein n=1 Tax=Cyanobacterium sp. HL-69 TaxID=2054282 RepID=UPI000CA3E9BF|nr:transcriptional regulator [Cyanobacterium sp. HL-69]